MAPAVAAAREGARARRGAVVTEGDYRVGTRVATVAPQRAVPRPQFGNHFADETIRFADSGSNDHYEEFLDDGGNEFIRYSDYLAESPEDFKKVEIFMRNIMLSLNCGDLDAFEEEMSVGYKNGNLFISFDDTDSSDEED